MEIRKELTLLETILFIFSPLFLIYNVDAEIFTLLPFLVLSHKDEKIRVWGGIFLIILACLIREISLLFFFPVLISFILNEKKLNRIISSFTLIFLILFTISPTPPPTYFLENTYWMDRGIDLKSYNLYQFADMRATEIITIHLGYILSKIELVVVPVLCFMLFILSVFYKRTQSLTGTIYILVMVSTCFLLTVDYGRYFYLFVMFIFLASQKKTTKLFSTFPTIPIIKDSSPIKRTLQKVEAYKIYLLLILVFSPSGFWAGAYQLTPRFYTLLIENTFFRQYTYFFDYYF
jgi:hypothetical protein